MKKTKLVIVIIDDGINMELLHKLRQGCVNNSVPLSHPCHKKSLKVTDFDMLAHLL